LELTLPENSEERTDLRNVVKSALAQALTAPTMMEWMDREKTLEKTGVPVLKTPEPIEPAPAPAPVPAAAPPASGKPEEPPTKRAYLAAAPAPQSNENRVSALKDGPYKFSSTQLDIPDPLKGQIKELGKRLIPNDVLAADGRETDPHVTVRYGLHNSDPGPVESLITDHSPIKLRIGKTSIFAGEAHDVVKLAVSSDDLQRLHHKLGALPHTDTHPEYEPHITLAYVAKGHGSKYSGDASLDGKEIVIDSLTFADIDGQRKTIRLCGPEKTDQPVKAKGVKLAQLVAPNYRPCDNPVEQCASCSFIVGTHCRVFDFDVKPDYVCDAWAAVPINQGQQVAKGFPPGPMPGEKPLERNFQPAADTTPTP
jgi:2'-5' RNA ligase